MFCFILGGGVWGVVFLFCFVLICFDLIFLVCNIYTCGYKKLLTYVSCNDLLIRFSHMNRGQYLDKACYITVILINTMRRVFIVFCILGTGLNLYYFYLNLWCVIPAVEAIWTVDFGLFSSVVELLIKVTGVPRSISGQAIYFYCIHMLILPFLLQMLFKINAWISFKVEIERLLMNIIIASLWQMFILYSYK